MTTTNDTITPQQFWALTSVIELQNVQKRNPFGSPEHKSAFDGIKSLLAKYMGRDFSEQYMGDYE